MVRDERSEIGVVSGVRGIVIVALVSALVAGAGWLLAAGLALLFPAAA